MEHQNQDESGGKNTTVRLNKEIVLPTTDTGVTVRLKPRRTVSLGLGLIRSTGSGNYG